MDDARREREHPRDDGLHPWVLVVCLVLASVACALILMSTIRFINDEPGTPSSVPTRQTR